MDPNLIYSDPAEYHRQTQLYTNAMIEARLAEASSAVVTPLASLAKAEARRDPKHAIVWEKYAPEIEAVIARLPEQSRAQPEMWAQAAKMVAGDHIDELARVEADRIIARSNDSGMLPTQTGSANMPIPSGGSPLDKLFHDRDPAVKGFLDDGIPVATVKAHAAAKGYSEADYAKLLTDRVGWRARA